MKAARALITLASIAAGIHAAAAAAQSADDDFWLEAAAYWPKVDTTVQVSSTNNPTVGTEIDLESDLNLDDGKALPAFAAGARLSDRFRIGLEYYSLGRSASTTLARDIVFDDVTYPATATIDSEFDSAIYRATVGYSFVRKANAELGAAIGLHATDFSVQLAGQGSLGGAAASFQSKKRDLLAPLPTVGLYGSFEALPGLMIGGNVDYLSLKIGGYDGRLVNAQAKVSYRVLRNIAIGAMYRYVDYRVDVEKDLWRGRLAYQFNGPALFVLVGF